MKIEDVPDDDPVASKSFSRAQRKSLQNEVMFEKRSKLRASFSYNVISRVLGLPAYSAA